LTESRRDLIRTAAAIPLGALILNGAAGCVSRARRRLTSTDPETVARDERFWSDVRAAFRLSTDFTNLENGWLSPQFEEGVDEVCAQARRINAIPAFYMRTMLAEDTREVRDQLAAFARCPREEVLLTRNTTESLNIVIMGMPLEAGDEAVFAKFEYGSMKVAFRQRAARDGIVAKEIDLPATKMSDDEIVAAYRDAITERTRVILVSHVVYLSGQVLPVRRISDMAHARGVEVIVDGAHGFAHLADRITDLGGDYYGASLHKWMCAPLGTGILYVKREKVAALWPLFGDGRFASDEIEKLGHIGTKPAYVQLAVMEAIRFNESIGLELKEARLRYLKDHWVQQLEGVPRIVLETPGERERSCAIALVGIEDVDANEIARVLLERYGIYTVAPGFRRGPTTACRISPHLYTSTAELDRFVAAMKELATQVEPQALSGA